MRAKRKKKTHPKDEVAGRAGESGGQETGQKGQPTFGLGAPAAAALRIPDNQQTNHRCLFISPAVAIRKKNPPRRRFIARPPTFISRVRPNFFDAYVGARVLIDQRIPWNVGFFTFYCAVFVWDRQWNKRNNEIFPWVIILCSEYNIIYVNYCTYSSIYN